MLHMVPSGHEPADAPVEAGKSTRDRNVATCPRHPSERVLAPCYRCGDYVCLNCVKHDDKGEAFCPLCAPNDALPLATLSQRLLGHATDMFLLYGGAMAGGLLSNSTLGLYVVALFVAAINLTMVHRKGQSLGKLLTGTRLVTVKDRRVSLWHALVRWPFFGLGLIDALFALSESRRALHDLVAGTRVVTEASSRHLYE
jgi:uncharacterized RDD family membrane protein YckC